MTTAEGDLLVQTGGRLGGREAGKALLAYLAAQAVVWIAAGVIVVTRAGPGAAQAVLVRELVGLIPVALPASLVASGVALLFVLRRWRRKIGKVALADTLGWSWGTPRQLVTGALAGVTLALFVLPLVASLSHRPEAPDLATQLATSSRPALWAWLVSAVLLAPPVEELMFRGALLGGLARTRAVWAAALISGTTFWLMHGPEFVHWPAAVSIGLMTILVTSLRVRTGILGPSVAAHFGYNLMIASLVSVSLLHHQPVEARWAGKVQAAETSRSA
jgi:membrane protease YdiL (CAAX protease family)